LHSDVKTCAVEGFKHDFGSVFAVLGRVERWFGKKKVVVFGLDAEVFEDAVRPEALHVILIGRDQSDKTFLHECG
jgi:hypothetical protein